MAIMKNEPEISERFDLDDIRKIREYNAARYEKMTPAKNRCRYESGSCKTP